MLVYTRWSRLSDALDFASVGEIQGWPSSSPGPTNLVTHAVNPGLEAVSAILSIPHWTIDPPARLAWTFDVEKPPLAPLWLRVISSRDPHVLSL